MDARFIVTGICGLIGGICSVTAIRMAAALWRASFWPSAEGTVTESFLRRDLFQPLLARQPVVAYEFVVSTKIRGTTVDLKFHGHRPRLSMDSFWGIFPPLKLVSSLPIGSKVKVYYDPSHPNNNCLDRDEKSALYILSLVALGSFGLAWFELYPSS